MQDPTATIPFPQTLPAGVRAIEDDPVFDPGVHLALSPPEQIVSLVELGYSAATVATAPSEFAVSSAFRLLTDEGVAALQQVCQQLESEVVSCARIERMMRGGVYRSKFLRDLCLSPEVNEFIGDLCGTAVSPHGMPHQLGHLNFQPRELGRNVDKWHHDTLGIDYVLMVTDPAQIDGGEFQYFRGTREEAAAYRQRGETIPEERIGTPHFPGPGYAVLQQGNLVVHRAAPLKALGDRITMVNGYSFADPHCADPTDYSQLELVDPHPTISAEWLRHRAYRAQRQLEDFVAKAELDADPAQLTDELRHCIAELACAVALVEDESSVEIAHYGD